MVLLLLVRGPMSAYRLANHMVELGAFEVPRSGFKSVERSVVSRLKKLEALGFVCKDDSVYRVSSRVILDDLKIDGRYSGLTIDMGWTLVFDTDNGHYVLFEIDSILEGIDPLVVEKVLSGSPIYIPLTNNRSGVKVGGG